MVCLAMMLHVSYWYPSTIGPLWPTMTDLVLREVLWECHKVPGRTERGVKRTFGVRTVFFWGTLVCAGEGGWGGG